MRIGKEIRRYISESVETGKQAVGSFMKQIELTESEIKQPWRHRESLQKKSQNAREIDIMDLWESLIGSTRSTCYENQDWNQTQALLQTTATREANRLQLSEAEVQASAFQLLTQAKLFTTMHATYELTPAVSEKLFSKFDSPYKVYDHQIPSDAPTVDFTPEGKEYPTKQLVDRFCQTKALKFGGRIELTRETMIADRTGQVVMQAEGLAESAKYREDELAALAFADSSNATLVPDVAEQDAGAYFPERTQKALYRTSAVSGALETYQSSINKVVQNLIHWDNIAAAIQKLRAMVNPRSGQFIETVGDTLWIVVPFGLEQRAGLLTATGNGALTVLGASSDAITTRAPDPIKRLGVSTINFLTWNKLPTAATASQSTWYLTGMPQKQCRIHQRWPAEFSRATAAQLGGDDFKRDIIVAVRGGFNSGARQVDDKLVIQNTNA